MKQSTKVVIIILLISIIMFGMFTLFAQFNSELVQQYYLTHEVQNEITYYEWSDDGKVDELESIYSTEGFLIELKTSGNTDIQRVGFSCVLKNKVDGAILKLSNRGDIPYIVFLDDDILYTDFPGKETSLNKLPTEADGIYRQYGELNPRIISLSLPENYVGRTLTIVEYITSEQAMNWYPVIPEIINSETNQMIYMLSYGPKAISSGVIVAILIVLTVLFIWQIFNNKKPWLLFLPIVFLLMQMITTSNYYTEYFILNPVKKINELISAFSRYCGGDLLLIFISLKMKSKKRFSLLIIACSHFVITSGLLIAQYILKEDLFLSMQWLGILGITAFILAIIFMLLESKYNRYFKYSKIGILLFPSIFALMLIFFKFTNYDMFMEIFIIFESALIFHFYPLIQLLSYFMLIVVTVFSIYEYITEFVEQHTRLTTLEQINNLKTQFLGNVSHELKTPLTVMSSYAQLTAKSLSKQPDTNTLQNHMKLIESEADRLSLMVSQILDVTRIEENRLSIQAQSHSLVDIIQRTLDTYYPLFSKNRNKLIFETPGSNPNVLCDPHRIMQVIVNLISNASHHTQNGTITLRISNDDNFATVEIEDTGKGMSDEQLNHLFDRYYTIQSEKNDIGRNTGTGLGLYICQHIIKEHNGEITVTSELGKGTTIYFTLPLSS